MGKCNKTHHRGQYGVGDGSGGGTDSGGTDARSTLFRSLERGDFKALRAAPKALRDDPEVVLRAIKVGPRAMAFASPRLQGDEHFVRAAGCISADVLQFVAPELRSNREVVLDIVRSCAYSSNALTALQHAKREVTNDKDVCLEAVRRYPPAYAFVGKDVRTDVDIMVAATQGNGGWKNLREGPEEMKSNPTVVMYCVRDDWRALRFATLEVQADADIALEALRQSWQALSHAAPSLREDKRFMLAAVAVQPFALRFADDALRADEEVVLAACQGNGYALQFAIGPAAASPDCIVVACADKGEIVLGYDTSVSIAAGAGPERRPRALRTSLQQHAGAGATPAWPFQAWIQEQLNLREAFRAVLVGVFRRKRPRCFLPHLNGFSHLMKRLVADFAGLCYHGPAARHLTRAAEQLHMAPSFAAPCHTPDLAAAGADADAGCAQRHRMDT